MTVPVTLFDDDRRVERSRSSLRAAAQTHEERKLPYLAHLIAAVTFEPDLSYAHANQLIGFAEQ